MGKKQDKELIKTIKLAQPKNMSYNIAVPQNSKDRDKLVKRIESEIRRSMEYRDYIQFLKQHVGLDSCIFFQNVSTAGDKKKRVSIELHHEPFTLYDYVNVVLQKFIDSGLPLNTLLIADEVLEIISKETGLINNVRNSIKRSLLENGISNNSCADIACLNYRYSDDTPYKKNFNKKD